jgi:hypothetical protein
MLKTFFVRRGPVRYPAELLTSGDGFGDPAQLQ